MKESATKICKILQDHGFQAVFAGGCVRDMIMKLPFHDIDIATSATPKEVQNIFKRTVPIGESFGVIQVHMDGFQFEVATFRTDSKNSDGRRPDSIKFSSMEEDAKRRDLTINALFYDPITEKIYDFVDGRKDIMNKILRFVGDPKERLEEDQLRSLRAIRFMSRFNLHYEDFETREAISEADLSKISMERVKSELDKMILDANCTRSFMLLDYFGLLRKIIPELSELKFANHNSDHHPEGNPWIHTMKVLSLVEERTNNINVLWGALLHDIGKPATEKLENGMYTNHGHDEVGAKIAVDILRRFKAPNSQIEEVEFLVSQHMRLKSAPVMRKSKIARLKAEKYYEDLRLLSECDSLATGIESNLDWTATLDEVEEYKELPKPLVNGYDLISLGMRPGTTIGRILSLLMDSQLEGKFKDRDEALHEAKILVFKEKQMKETFEYNMSKLFE